MGRCGRDISFHRSGPALTPQLCGLEWDLLPGSQLPHLSYKKGGSHLLQGPFQLQLAWFYSEKTAPPLRRGNVNILSAAIQPRHMFAQPHPSHLARSCCHDGHALGTMLSSLPQEPGPQVGGSVLVVPRGIGRTKQEDARQEGRVWICRTER